MSESTEVKTVLDTDLASLIEYKANEIHDLEIMTEGKVNQIVLDLIVATADRLNGGLPQLVAKFTITESAKVAGFSASKVSYFQTALAIMEKEPAKVWDSKELLSIAERIFRQVGLKAKGIEGAPKGIEGAKKAIESAKTVDVLVKALPPVEARKAPEARIKSPIEASEIMVASLKEALDKPITPEMLQALARVTKMIAEVSRVFKDSQVKKTA